jgi:hypothetical protein
MARLGAILSVILGVPSWGGSVLVADPEGCVNAKACAKREGVICSGRYVRRFWSSARAPCVASVLEVCLWPGSWHAPLPAGGAGSLDLAPAPACVSVDDP